MDASVNEMCNSLLKWMQTVVPNVGNDILDLSDGVAVVHALIQISPEHFESLLPKIKKDVGTNWRLRVSNLKKIVQAITDYYQDILSLQLRDDVAQPDVNALSERNDIFQLTTLLRLVLGCAIYCDKKQDYITSIMQLEESVQQNIMQAIQQLEEAIVGPGKSGLSLLLLDSDSRNRLVGELEATNKDKENLAKQCIMLESQIQVLNEEKQNILLENETLKNIETKYKEGRKQMEMLKEELFKDEILRDDLKAKIAEQEKQIQNYLEKISELTLQANVTSKLKDEVDALSESALKVQDLELTVNSYKKRLDKYRDIKKVVQSLEDKNKEYLQKNLELEEELSKVGNWKTQCETFKQQIANLQQKLDEENQRADKAEFSVAKLQGRLMTMECEKARLIEERDQLKEENEELNLVKPEHKTGIAMSRELTPTEIEERYRFLEKENKMLKKQRAEFETKQTFLENDLTRLENLQQQNRTLNQTVLKLEAVIEELKSGKSDQSTESQDGSIKDLKQKINLLEESLRGKEYQYQSLLAKYNKSLEKAKQVAQHLDIKTNGNVENPLHSQMSEKEQNFLTTAFYRISLACYQEALDKKIANLSSSQGQSFLARQRQPTPRKQIPRYKPK